MNWAIKTISNYGTSHPVVARLGLQTHELIRFSSLPQADQDAVVQLYLGTLQPRLLKCHDIFERLQKLTAKARAKARKQQSQARGSVRFVPVVIGLDGEAESFLYEVKNYLRDLLHLFRIFFGFKDVEASKLYDAKGKGDSAIVKWASEQFGDDDELSQLLSTEQKWVGQCIRMRNAAEHPGGKSGKFTIYNVRAIPEGFIPPTWNLEGEPESDIFADMRTMMSNLLTIAEELLIACIKKKLAFPNIAFYQIPEKDQDPKAPQRVRVGLLPEVEARIAAMGKAKSDE